MVAVDADTTENSTHDWGHSLIPETQLSVLAVAGLAPGDDPTYAGGAPENSAPLWATAVYPQDSTSSGNITVYVDYNGDGNTQPTGGGTDANTGLDYDVSYSIAELERLKIYTDADGNGTADIADQTGTKVWTSGSDALIAIAYGQDPNTAAVGSPAVDLGTTVPGIPLLLASIGCTIVNDLNGNGLVDLGDTVDYEINVENAGAGPIAPNTVTVVNTPASEITYVTGSSTLDDGTLVNVADDSVGTPSPVDEGGYTYNNQLNPSNQFTLRFEAIITDIPSNGTITNVVDVIGLTSTISALHTFNYNPSPEVDIVTTAGSTPDGDIHKITSAGNVTYTYTITNEGLSHLADLVITDDNGTPGNPADDITLTATECPDLAGPLAPNAAIVCTDTRLISADTTNTASVTGNPVNAAGDDLAGVADPTDSDPADVAIVGSISDLVWNDTNGDGIKDSGETGINGITVNLRDPADDSIIDTVTTSGGGLYSFTQLVAGNYIVEFVPPTNYLFSPQSASGSTSANDSNPNTITERVSVSLASGQNTDEIDAGLYLPVSISNFVWDDRDADGIQDGGEPGLDGVTVRLYTPRLSEITSTTTTGGGLYSFTGLVAGSYVIHVDTPSGWLHSPANATTDSVDSDPNTSTVNTTTYVLSASDNNDTVDVGLYNPGSISDLVWVDTNGNGIQDSGESGLNGVTVNLLDPNNSDAVLDTTTTAGGGLYSFTGLVAATYAIQFVLPNGYSFSPQTATGGTSATDSDPDPSTGRTSNIVLSAGENDDEIDSGIFLSGSIGDLVWNDIDADGINDVGESGLDGVTVNLRDPDNSNALLATTVTAGGGAYLFTNLVANNYVVEFVAPNGYDHSPANQVDDDADSDANVSTGLTAEIILTAGEDDETVDAGFYQPASVSNFVWGDTNGNGIQDGGETGIDGVTVRLLDPDNSDAVISSTATSGGGLYSFIDLAPNNYVLEFVTPTGYSPSPANAGNDDVDSDASTSNGRTAEFTLAANKSNEDFDAGFFQPASISDLVWDDYDGGGVKDAGEPGLDGVTVNLRDPNNSNAIITTDVTALGGLYSFGNLDPGDYVVEFVLPNNYVASPQNATTGTAVTDSDADPTTGLTATINLTSGDNDDSIDAGFYQPGSISNLVWYDLNANGIQDASEPGLDGVTVRLLDTSDNELATTTTVNGVYSFSNLGAGDYVVEFVNPGNG